MPNIEENNIGNNLEDTSVEIGLVNKLQQNLLNISNNGEEIDDEAIKVVAEYYKEVQLIQFPS